MTHRPVILGALILHSILPQAMGTEPVTAVYQDKVGGYAGTRDIWIREAVPDSQAGGTTHVYVGRYKNQEWKGLVKFTASKSPSARRFSLLGYH